MRGTNEGGRTEAAEAARRGDDAVEGRRVIVDTNEVLDKPGVERLLKPGEKPVITDTIVAELKNNVARGKHHMPRYASELDVIRDSMDVDLRINMRASIKSKKGLFGDGVIGATAVRTRSPVITNDKHFADALRDHFGVEVRMP